MSEFVRVASLKEIPQGTMKAFEIKHRRIVVANTEEGVFAVADECTHDSAPISDGRLRPGGEIMCTRHGARFKLATGEVTAPPALAPLETYEVKLQGDDILVKLD